MQKKIRSLFTPHFNSISLWQFISSWVLILRHNKSFRSTKSKSMLQHRGCSITFCCIWPLFLCHLQPSMVLNEAKKDSKNHVSIVHRIIVFHELLHHWALFHDSVMNFFYWSTKYLQYHACFDLKRISFYYLHLNEK